MHNTATENVQVVHESLTQYGVNRKLIEYFIETAPTKDVIKVGDFITSLLVKELS